MKKLHLSCFAILLVASIANASPAPSSRITEDLEAIKAYGIAWNTGDIDGIVNHFTDDSEFVYTDALASPNIVCGKQIGGIRSKSDMRAYATSTFKVFPKQIWNDSVEVFLGSTPGTYAIYYHFSLFENTADTSPAFTGTGMENLKLDENHKLVREEIHLSFSQGQVDSSASLGIPNFYRNKY